MSLAAAWRRILCWLAPAAGVGTLAAQDRSAESAIQVDTLRPRSVLLAPAPMVRVFLPPGYHAGSGRYPVLYANDGQDMELLGLVATLERLYAMKEIQPLIVVAVHAGEERLQRYGTAGESNTQGLGSDAGQYEAFLLAELLPAIAREYRTVDDRSWFMGWSLGGLAAFDLAWRNPDQFRGAGVFSGSFWWRTDDSSVEARQASRIMHRRVRQARRPPRLRAWFQAGRQDETADRDGNGVIDAIQDTRELIAEMARHGLVEGRDIAYLEVEGGHDHATWGRALPDFLRWAYGASTSTAPPPAGD